MSYYIQLQNNRKIIKDVIEKFSFNKYHPEQNSIEDRIDNPKSYVMMLGETGSGKSTLLNGLLQRAYLPVSSAPKTGEITEIEFNSSEKKVNFYGIFNNGKSIALSQEDFFKLNSDKNKDYQRLKLVTPELPYRLEGMSIFDTPGFGSIHDEHEEVLKNFIPQSDCIIYVISYRAGLIMDDSEFIRFLRDNKDDSVGIFLVINRTPTGIGFKDSRIKEIRGHFSELYHLDPPCYIIYTDNPNGSKKDSSEIMPKAEELWTDLSEWLKRDERQNEVYRGILILQLGLLSSLKEELLVRQMNASEKEELKKAEKDLFNSKDEIIDLIKKDFATLKKNIPKIVHQSRENISNQINQEIDENGIWTEKDECLGFVRGHLLYYLNRVETDNISQYVSSEIECLNEKIKDMLNTAIGDYERQISDIDLKYSDMALDYGKTKLDRVLVRTLTEFFAGFGGRGGAKAGVTNVAKMGLKKFGGIFGKTFSKETHNSLAVFLKKIGANSSKAIALAGAVLAEAVIYIVDSLTWKFFLRREVEKALKKWSESLIIDVNKDLSELEEHNYNFIDDLFSEFGKDSQIDSSDLVDMDACEISEFTKNLNVAIEETKKIIKE